MFDVWLYKVLVRTAWRILTQNKNKNVSLDNLNESSVENFEYVSTENIFDRNETRIVIRKAVSKLNEPLRVVVILYYFNGMTTDEISRILGCFRGTVKSRLYNARKILKKYLVDDFSITDLDVDYYGKELRTNG